MPKNVSNGSALEAPWALGALEPKKRLKRPDVLFGIVFWTPLNSMMAAVVDVTSDLPAEARQKAAHIGKTIELKSAPSSPSRSPTPRRFKHSHLASRVSEGERRVSGG
jgi:hypothetical protein